MALQTNVRLILLVLLLCSACGIAAPVEPEFDSVPTTHDYIRQDAGARSRVRTSPTLGAVSENNSPGRSKPQLLQMQDLKPEELFKAMLVYDTQQVQKDHSTLTRTNRPPEVGGAIRKDRSTWHLEDLPFTSRDYIVTFDRNRPAVQLPHDRQALNKAVQNYALNRWKAALRFNNQALDYDGGVHPFERKNRLFEFLSFALEDESAKHRLLTTSQVTKDALEAIVRSREWAAQLNAAQPGMMDKEAVERSLLKTWSLWHKGLSDLAKAYTNIEVKEIASKFHR